MFHFFTKEKKHIYPPFLEGAYSRTRLVLVTSCATIVCVSRINFLQAWNHGDVRGQCPPQFFVLPGKKCFKPIINTKINNVNIYFFPLKPGNGPDLILQWMSALS